MTHSPLGPYPTHTSVEQLVWLIRAAAQDDIEPLEFIKSFRTAHEALDATGRIRYVTKEQARLIWDVLWDLEYYSPDPTQEDLPEEWHGIEQVIKTVKRVGPKLAEL